MCRFRFTNAGVERARPQIMSFDCACVPVHCFHIRFVLVQISISRSLIHMLRAKGQLTDLCVYAKFLARTRGVYCPKSTCSCFVRRYENITTEELRASYVRTSAQTEPSMICLLHAAFSHETYLLSMTSLVIADNSFNVFALSLFTTSHKRFLTLRPGHGRSPILLQIIPSPLALSFLQEANTPLHPGIGQLLKPR